MSKNIKSHGSPGMTQEQFQVSAKLEEEIRLQPRKVRIKNFGYLVMFSAWYAGVVLFIMYRLRSDDLDQLEMEAEKKIRQQTLQNQASR